MHESPLHFSRRDALRAAAVGTFSIGAAALLAGCTPSPQEGATVTPEADRTTADTTGNRVLLAYFSRAGENYYYGATVARNVREEQQDARPAIDGDLPSLNTYDTVLLGSPVWNVQTPMIMRTFVESLDFDGKTVHPFVTYAVSRMGNVRSDYRRLIPNATITEGLAVQGETVNDASSDVAGWLESLDLPRK